MRFDAGSSEPIVRIEFSLDGTGENPQVITFEPKPGSDGRYFRALAFKPTVNGTWPLLMTAVDAVGRSTTVRCTPGITVVF